MEEKKPQNQYYKEESIDIFQMLSVIWNYKYFISSITAVSTVIGLVFAVVAKPVFYSEAIIRRIFIYWAAKKRTKNCPSYLLFLASLLPSGVKRVFSFSLFGRKDSGAPKSGEGCVERALFYC